MANSELGVKAHKVTAHFYYLHNMLIYTPNLRFRPEAVSFYFELQFLWFVCKIKPMLF